jgi:hypothetical protein
MFINISNHPSTKWSPEQIAAAEELGGEIVDLGFPQVDPEEDEMYMGIITRDWYKKVLETLGIGPLDPIPKNTTIHLMGESGFCAALGMGMAKIGCVVVHSTTKRDVVENPETGEKTSVFRFVRFRRTY